MSITYDFSWLTYNSLQFTQFLNQNDSNLNSGYFYQSGQTVTYSFYTLSSPPPSSFFNCVPSGQIPAFTPFSNIEQIFFNSITSFLGATLNLKFQQVAAGKGDTNLGLSNQTTAGYSTYPFHGNTLSINVDGSSNNAFTSYYKTALWHEFGHNLGLEHPNSYTLNSAASSGGHLLLSLDTTLLTIMSYDDCWVQGNNFAGNVNMQDYAALDWFELASKYGTNKSAVIDYSITINNAGSIEPDFTFSNSSYTGQADLLNPFCLPCTNSSDTLKIHSSSAVTLNANTGQVLLSAEHVTSAQVFNYTSGSWVALPSGTGFSDINLVPIDNVNFFQLGQVTLPDFNNTIIDGNYFKKIVAGNGNDSFSGFSSGLSIDGGAGTNTLSISDSSHYYKFVESTPAQSSLTNSLNQTMSLSNITSLIFSNQTLQTKWFTEALSLAQINPTEFATLTEMYLAYFNRAPDAVGLDYWASSIYEGQNNLQVASNFALSTEAVSTYGQITAQFSNTAITNFVNGVYQNVLNRASDAGGLAYWVSLLQNGSVTPANFILEIINSVNIQTGTTDKIYLSSKEAVGAHFAITDGLTDGTQAHNVITAFNSTYTASGASTAINVANALADGYLAHVSTNPELIVQLVGVNGLSG